MNSQERLPSKMTSLLLVAAILVAILRPLGLVEAREIWEGSSTAPLAATSESLTPQTNIIHVVQEGELLISIAARYGSTVPAIMMANGLPNASALWADQQLRIPAASIVAPSSSFIRPAIQQEASPAITPSPTPSFAPPSPGPATMQTEPSPTTEEQRPAVHVVQRGEVLSRIGARYKVSVAALAAANGLADPNRIYPGQRLRIPAEGEVFPTPVRSTPTPVPATGGKWIEIDLSEQALMAWDGQRLMRRMLVSTGLPRTPTPTGRFRILSKYSSVPMSGPGYYLPAVPHTMFFYRGYAIHGTYWHNNFGRPMSHGCVNLSRADAAWLYAWTPLGTPVVIHW